MKLNNTIKMNDIKKISKTELFQLFLQLKNKLPYFDYNALLHQNGLVIHKPTLYV